MEVTERQESFIDILVSLMQEEEMIVGVALLLQTDNQMEQMVKFLEMNLQGEKLMIEDDQVLKKAIEISKQVQ